MKIKDNFVTKIENLLKIKGGGQYCLAKICADHFLNPVLVLNQRQQVISGDACLCYLKG